MLARIVSLAAGGGAAELRRLRARLVAGAIALAALLIAVGFALAALFLWLATRMEPWQAALLAALAALALAGIALKEAEDKPMTAVATGLAAGVVLGRLL